MYGLATPEDFTLPPHHTLWTEESYKAFEVVAENSEKYDTKVKKKSCSSIHACVQVHDCMYRYNIQFHTCMKTHVKFWNTHYISLLFSLSFSLSLSCTQSSAAQEEINPVPEPDIAPGKVPQPQTKSGCVIS